MAKNMTKNIAINKIIKINNMTKNIAINKIIKINNMIIMIIIINKITMGIKRKI